MGEGRNPDDLDGPTEPIAERPPDTLREPVRGVPGIGDVVAGRYQVERLLGSGGMGHVLLATHVGLGRRVAVKFLDPSLLQNEQALERFAREARAMAALTSPHTVRVHDVGQLPSGLPYFVMEHLEGRDLAHELLDKGPLPAPAAVSYIVQACHAVEEAHAAGLVHRDLKPQNLFLSRPEGKEHVRVLDFGIARAVGGARIGKLSTLTRVGDVIGTLAYMAPEQLRNAKSVEMGTDIWSLGACLYRLLTGVPPFDAESEAALIEAVLLHPPTPISERRPNTPRVVADVVMRCLEKKPADRYPNARALRLALEATQMSSDRTVPLPRMLEPPPKPVPRPPTSDPVLTPPPTPAPMASRPQLVPAPVAQNALRDPRRGTTPSTLVLAIVVIAAAILVASGGIFVLLVLGDR